MSRMDDIKLNASKKAAEAKERSRRTWQDFRDHQLLYVSLIVSGFLSGLAGIAIGLGVRVTGGNVTAHFDFAHYFFAALYAVLFPTFYEYGLANWLYKYLHREEGNKHQEISALFMVILTFIGTAVTAFSAMDILVTSLGFFASFQEIPPSIQKWIAFSLPAMFMLNIAAGEFYRQFSTAAVLRRAAEMDLREKQIEADTEVQLAQMDAEKDIAIHSAEEYARRAKEETKQIGAQKGGKQWDKDREKHGISQPVQAYASETQTVKQGDNGKEPKPDFTQPPGK